MSTRSVPRASGCRPQTSERTASTTISQRCSPESAWLCWLCPESVRSVLAECSRLAGASALWGGLLGAYFGDAAGDSAWADHEDIGFTALDEGEVLVVACSHGHADAVRDMMQRHGGRYHTIEAGRV